MSNPFPFGTGKLFGSYLFFGSSVSIILVSKLNEIDNMPIKDIIFLIISLGSIIGSILSTFQIHKIASFVYFHTNLRNTLETDYKSFEEKRYTFYYRFILAFSGWFLLLTFILNPSVLSEVERILKQLFDSANVSQTFILILTLFTFFATVNWLINVYSNREPLLLLNYVSMSSSFLGGLPNLDERVQKIEEKLDKGNWKEAKAQFTNIIDIISSYYLIHRKMPQDLYSHIAEKGEFVDFNKLGICFIDPLSSKNFVVGFSNEINHNDFKQSNDSEQFNMYYELLLDFLESTQWRILSWEKFLFSNLPFWLKTDLYYKNLRKTS